MKILVNIALSVLAGACAAVAEPSSFEGTVSASLTQPGGETNRLVFTRQDDHLRIEIRDTNTPHPINLVDLSTAGLTILYPHNSTFARVPGKGADSPASGALPSLEALAKAGASVPALPSVTAPGLPPGIGAQVPGPPGAPAVPGIPFAMPPIPPLELKKTDETRTIHGLSCARYTLTHRHETLEVWAAADAGLFPFHPLERDRTRRRFGPPMLEEQWAGLLQAASLFPLEVTLRDDSGHERLSFKVTAIEKKKIDEKSSLFAVPAGFHEVKRAPF